MGTQYIARGIKHNQFAHDADIGMVNIIAMGEYASVKTAKRYLMGLTQQTKCAMRGYAAIGLYDVDGIILVISTTSGACY